MTQHNMKGDPECNLCRGTGTPVDGEQEICDCLFEDVPSENRWWRPIPDADVQLVFQCPEDCSCGKEEVAIHPSYIMDRGTPTCPRDEGDMEYRFTQIPGSTMDREVLEMLNVLSTGRLRPHLAHVLIRVHAQGPVLARSTAKLIEAIKADGDPGDVDDLASWIHRETEAHIVHVMRKEQGTRPEDLPLLTTIVGERISGPWMECTRKDAEYYQQHLGTPPLSYDKCWVMSENARGKSESAGVFYKYWKRREPEG